VGREAELAELLDRFEATEPACLAAHQRRADVAVADAPCPGQGRLGPVGLHGRLPSLDGDGVGPGVPDLCARALPDAFGDEGGVGGCGRFEAFGDVDGAAGDGVVAAADLAPEHVAGVDADRQRE